jgi:hypothetical protein
LDAGLGTRSVANGALSACSSVNSWLRAACASRHAKAVPRTAVLNFMEDLEGAAHFGLVVQAAANLFMEKGYSIERFSSSIYEAGWRKCRYALGTLR